MNQHTSDAWSDADVDRLKKLRAAKLSRVEIARIMGRTKGSIIGKLDRLAKPTERGPRGWNVKRAAQASKAARDGKPTEAPPKPQKSNPYNRNPWDTRHVLQPAEPKLKWPGLVANGKRAGPNLPMLAVTPTRSIAQLEHNHCRAIGERPDLLTIDTPLYCGQVTDGGSWCETHKASVFQARRNSGGG